MVVDEFLADGVIILYNLKQDGVRQRAAEILKMRGAKHDERMAATNITSQGIKIYPDQKIL
ncbi:ATPase domain-containing protein [Candidatus Nanohalovita haloferacivicina]|uniref:ATPase domain-containing protein n=1 Tax=Candidatus Nanohalovita haloferacivicina TaxID=2978046 RepID=UPI003D330A38